MMVKYRSTKNASGELDEITNIDVAVLRTAHLIAAKGVVECSFMPGDGTHYQLMVAQREQTGELYFIHLRDDNLTIVDRDGWVKTHPKNINSCTLALIEELGRRLQAILHRNPALQSSTHSFYDFKKGRALSHQTKE